MDTVGLLLFGTGMLAFGTLLLRRSRSLDDRGSSVPHATTLRARILGGTFAVIGAATITAGILSAW